MADTFSKSPSFDPVALSDLQQGESAVVGEFALDPQVSDHLMNLGFVPGVEVTVAQSGPGGDPRVYRIEGTAVALRRDLASCISVAPIPAKDVVPAADPALVLSAQVSAD